MKVFGNLLFFRRGIVILYFLFINGCVFLFVFLFCYLCFYIGVGERGVWNLRVLRGFRFFLV